MARAGCWWGGGHKHTLTRARSLTHSLTHSLTRKVPLVTNGTTNRLVHCFHAQVLVVCLPTIKHRQIGLSITQQLLDKQKQTRSKELLKR